MTFTTPTSPEILQSKMSDSNVIVHTWFKVRFGNRYLSGKTVKLPSDLYKVYLLT